MISTEKQLERVGELLMLPKESTRIAFVIMILLSGLLLGGCSCPVSSAAAGTTPPTVSFIIQRNGTNVVSAMENQPLVLTGNATINNNGNFSSLNFTWSFGDSTNGNGAWVRHTFTTIKIFNVVLSVRDSVGNVANLTRSLVITSSPRPDLRLISMIFSPTIFTVGEQGTIKVNVSNVGNDVAILPHLEFYLLNSDSSKSFIGNETSFTVNGTTATDLNPGQYGLFSFGWVPSSLGNFTILVTAVVDREINLADNSDTSLINVVSSGGQVGDYTYTVSGGNATITGYNGSGGTITIPSALGGYPTVNIGPSAFENNVNLTSVTIPDNVTVIWEMAFDSCSNLTSVKIGDGVKVIAWDAFYSCNYLTTVIIGSNVTSIEEYAFSDCASLTSMTLPRSLIVIGDGAFSYCTSLTSVNLGNNVTSIAEYAFQDCTHLASVTIPINVTVIGSSAFGGCSSLIAINVSAGNPNLASVDGVLYNKNITTLIECPGGKVGPFIIPGSVTYIEDVAANDCTFLTSATIPNSVNHVGDDAFYGCTSLTSMTIGNGVTTFGVQAFGDCTSLTSITVNPDNPNYASVDGVLYNKNITTLIECPGGRTGAFTVPSSVTSIRGWSCNDCPLLTAVNIPDSVDSIGDSSFRLCNSLTSLNISGAITFIGNQTFSLCNSLRSITIPANVTTIWYGAFYHCSNLTSMTFLGLIAPTFVAQDWIDSTPAGIRGHAYAASDFPAPGSIFNGLTMGANIKGVPGTPTDLSAIAGNGEVILSWRAPVSDGGYYVTGFNVYRSMSMTGNYSLISTPQDLAYPDTGLINNRTYWYSISAVNAAGEGAKTAPISSTPIAPSYLTPSFSWHNNTKGYSILVPDGWTALDNATVGGNQADTLIWGPIISGFHTNVGVKTGTDASITDTQAYLSHMVQSTISGMNKQGVNAVMTGTPQYVKISNYSAVVFGIDDSYSGVNVHQEVALIIDASHSFFWTIICSESRDARAQLDPIFSTIIYGFAITSVPSLSNADIFILVAIVIMIGAIVVALAFVLLRRKGKRKAVPPPYVLMQNNANEPSNNGSGQMPPGNPPQPSPSQDQTYRSPPAMNQDQLPTQSPMPSSWGQLKYCPWCGVSTTGSQFCGNCGKEIGTIETPTKKKRPQTPIEKLGGIISGLGAFAAGWGTVALVNGQDWVPAITVGAIAIIIGGAIVTYERRRKRAK